MNTLTPSVRLPMERVASIVNCFGLLFELFFLGCVLDGIAPMYEVPDKNIVKM